MSKQEKGNINEKIAALNEYLEWFNGDDFTLEQSIEKYNEAKKLADEIQANLAELKNEITVVEKRFDTDTES